MNDINKLQKAIEWLEDKKGNSYDTYADIYNRCYSNSHTI